MAFEDKETTEAVASNRVSRPYEIIQRERPDDPTGPPDIIVVWRETLEGEVGLVSKRVPRATVNTIWPSATMRTFRDWLRLIIDNATE